MELLLQLLALLLVLPFWTLIADLVVLALLLLVTVFEVFAAYGGTYAIAAFWKRRRALRISLVSVAALLAIAALLMNTVLFETTLRAALARWKDKTGVAVDFHAASGNWFSGRVELDGVRVSRGDSERSEFDLQAAAVRLRIRMGSLLGGEASLQSLEIDGLRGTYERTAPRGSHGRGRDFAIDRLALRDAEVLFRDRPLDEKPAEMKLVLKSLEAAPFRRRSAVFDALFRATASGTIDGSPFSIASEGGPGARTTRWQAADLPLRFLSDYAGGGFAWFRSGRADLDAAATWSEESREINSHWKIRLKSPVAQVPDSIEGWKRPLAEAAAAFVNRHPPELPLEFDLAMSRDQFDGALSVEATGLFTALGGAFAKRLAELAQVPVEKIQEYGRRSLEAFKGYLQHWRKK